MTAFAWLGAVRAVRHARHDAGARALLAALAACLLLSFGRTTFGGLAALLPGSGDIFFRRFMMGVQLAALLLAGPEPPRGALELAAPAAAAASPGSPSAPRSGAAARSAARRVLAGCAATVLSSRRRGSSSVASTGTTPTRSPHSGEQTRRPGGSSEAPSPGAGDGARVYAGEPTNWGASFTVGAVPVYKYLESLDSRRSATRCAPRR